MSDKDEFIRNDNESSCLRKDDMFLPIHVETGGDPEAPRRDKAEAKTATLSPVLLSPGSTTKKLIESGKIKHCVILLQKASLDPSYIQSFTRKDASSPEILHGEGEPSSSPGGGDHLETTESTTPLTDNGAGDLSSTESEGDGHPITSRNIFLSFYHEWPASKMKCQEDTDISDGESIPGENTSNQDTSFKDVGTSKIDDEDDDAMSVSSTGESIPGETTSNQDTSFKDVGTSKIDDEDDDAMSFSSTGESISGENTLNQDTSFKYVGTSKIDDEDDDAMSVSSTGSRETAVYPIHAREDTPDMYEVMTDDETVAADTESDDCDDLNDEPPCLESLESLPAPGHCLDHPPVLSPRVLFGASDFYPLDGTDPMSQPELDSEAHEVPDGTIDRPVSAEVMSVADNSELDEDTSPDKPPRTEQFDARQSNPDTGVSVTCSTDCTEEQTDKTDQIQRTSSTESEHQREQRQDALKNVINDVFLSHPSSGIEEVFSNEENSSDNLQDLTNTTASEKDHCEGNEYEDMLQQIVDSTKPISSDDADQEALYSAGAPEEDSAVTEIVSLGEGIPTMPQDENISEDAPNVGVTKDQSRDTPDQSSAPSFGLPDANVGPNNPSPENASRSQSLETPQHAFLTNIDSQTELDKTDRQTETNRTQDDQENVLDANIEVAEVVIESHVQDPQFHPDTVGIMFPLDLRTCVDNANDPEQDPDQNEETDKQTHSKQTKAEFTVINKDKDSNSVYSTTDAASKINEKSCSTNDSGGKEIPNLNCSVVPNVSSRSGLPSVNSEERAKAPRPAAERRPQEETGNLSNSSNVQGSPRGEGNLTGPHTVPRASSESSEYTMNRDSVTETMTKSSKPDQNPPSRQHVATSSAHGPQGGSITGEIIARSGVFHQTPRRTLKTKELDTALSLAFMSEIMASNEPRKMVTDGNVASASRHPPFVPASQRADVRIRHQSAPKASVVIRQEDNPEANARRPHSTQGPATQDLVARAEVCNNFQQTKFDRGSVQDKSSNKFNYSAVSSGSAPLQAGKCKELIWHLTQTPSQKQSPHPERGQPGNAPQQAKMPHTVTHPKATVLQHEPSIPPKQLHAKDSSHRGIPIQLPADKRFLASNLDASDYPGVGVNANRGNAHNEAPVEKRHVVTPNYAAGFSGPGVTFSQQLAKNTALIAQPTSTASVKSLSTNQQEGRTGTRPYPMPFTNAIYLQQDLRSVQTTASTVSGANLANQQQRQLITTPQQTQSFVPVVLSARPLSPKRAAYLSGQPHTVTETHQAPARCTSYNVPGVAVTQPTIIVVKPTSNVATVVSAGSVVLQAERVAVPVYNQSVRSHSPHNPNVTFLPTVSSTEANSTRQENRQGNIHCWNPQQLEQQKLLVSSVSSAIVSNAQRPPSGTPTTNFSQVETLRQYAARNNEYHHDEKSTQPAVSTPISAEALYMQQDESPINGRNCGPPTRAQPTEQTMAQTLTQPSLMNLSASAYIGDLAKATRSRVASAAIAPGAHETFHPQAVRPASHRYQTALDMDSIASSRERGDTDAAFGEQPPRSDSTGDPKQKARSFTVPTSLESNATYAAHDARLSRPASTTSSQDQLQTTEYWTQAEKALLKSLPEQLSNYLVKQRRTQGIQLEESLKAVLASLLNEEEVEKASDTEGTRRETTRVWHSTVHHRATDATTHSDKETDLSSREPSQPTDVPTQNLLEPCPTPRPIPPVQNATQNQGKDRGLPEALQPDHNAQQRQLVQPSAKSTLRFYNPAPSLTPLMNPDVVSDVRDQRLQGESGSSKGDTESAVDLTMKTSRTTPQMTHGGIGVIEHHTAYPNYTQSIGNLYPRAYSAGQYGPIMPSSYAPILAAPLKRHNLSPAQLLIRNKLLERRQRIQSRSISTPDIVRDCEQHAKGRKRKRDIAEPVIPPAKVPSPGRPPTSSHTECDIHPSVTAVPSPAVETIVSAEDVAHHKEPPSESARDLTSTDGREFVPRGASGLTQYPKMKSSLQNRWVTESVQPSTQPRIDDSNDVNPPRHGSVSGVNGIRVEQRLAQEQPSTTTTTITSGIQIANPVEQVTTTASDPGAVKTTSVVVEKKAPGSVPTPASRPEQAKEAQLPAGDRVKELLITGSFSCQFCSFRSSSLADVRLHTKRDHFSKHEKKNVSSSKQVKRLAGRPVANTQDAREVMSDATKTANVHAKGTSNKRSDPNGAALVELCTPAHRAGFVSADHGLRSHSHPYPAEAGNAILVAPSDSWIPGQPETTAALLHAANGIQMVNTAPASVTSQAMLSPSMTSKPAPHLSELSCSHCKLQFNNSNDLHFHVKFQHTDTKGLQMCFNCGYTAKTKYGLRKHIIRWHTQPEKLADSVYTCPHKKCDKTFTDIKELHRHTMTHDVNSKYECDLCGAKYRNLNGLRYHKFRHNLNYPHQCKQCGLNFKTVGVLHRHELQTKHFGL